MNFSIKNVKIKNLTICGDCDENVSSGTKSSFLQIDEKPEKFEEMMNEVTSPEELDSLTQKLGISARLVNYHLATPADLSFLNLEGINQAIHLPIMVSSREGGRESLYKLKKGETVLAGIFVNDKGILLRYIKRETGEGTFAEDGDRYRYSLKDTKGNLVYEGVGELTITDKKIGKGSVKFIQTRTDQIADKVGKMNVDVWIFWSCIKIRAEKDA